MSIPRQVLEGKTRLLTRRVIERRFFLAPSRWINNLIEYLLAVGSSKYGVLLVAIYFASDHYHLEVVDPEGRFPAFLQWFNSLLARAANCHRGRTDRFWDVKQANAPEIADAAAVLDRACYVLGNPVKDGLVARGRDWPGVRSTPQACTLPPKAVMRPDFFFDASERGTMAASAELVFHVPPEYEYLGPEGWARLFAEHLAAFEEQARADIASEGRSFLGAPAVRRQHWKNRARTPEGHGPKEVLHPLVIARGRAARYAVLARHLAFTHAHEAARQAMLAGQPDAIFPHGTYQYRHTLGVRCHSPP